MTSTRLRLVEWAERGAPSLTRAFTTPAVRGAQATSSPDGVLHLPRDGTPGVLVVLFPDILATSRWLAGSLASRLRATVLVADPEHDPASILARALTTLESVPSTTAVVGEGGGADAAVRASTAVRVARLALLYPPPLVVDDPAALPTTLLQAAREGENRSATVALDAILRRAGVAVRETEYERIPDGWARHPRVAPGSARALDDLVAFLERGLGVPSTFGVIPGWDLH